MITLLDNEFLQAIKAIVDTDFNAFYNDDGNTYAYRLNVKHISAASMLGYGTIRNGILVAEKELFIVDLVNHDIVKHIPGDRITIIPLISYD